MKNSLGVMQGRLLPKYKGRYQAHPVGYWQDEFPIAKSIGLDCIEFILDFNDFEKNPLSSEKGITELKQVIRETDISVFSICADYFMEAPLHYSDQAVVNESKEVLSLLLNHASLLGVKDIVIPCVDQSSLKTSTDKATFYNNLLPFVKIAEEKEIRLSLETDLNASEFLEIIQMFGSKAVAVNYDIGNSAALGFKPEDEFRAYGNFITDIHIKDRKLNSGSVELGTGNADFPTVISLINKLGYSGPFIMQAYRDDEGLEIFKRQLEWVRKNFLVGIKN